jgi:hypothetical protein
MQFPVVHRFGFASVSAWNVAALTLDLAANARPSAKAK